MNSDILTIDNNNSQEIIEDYQSVEKEVKYCLNCGTEINDKFCPHCGQSAATPSKLKMKNFGKGVIMSFGRLTPGFFNTAKGLLLYPWDVIRDHIHGKHIRYSPPITMIIQVFLYATILYTFLDSVFGTDLISIYKFDEGIGYKGENPILKMIDQSVVFQTFFIGVPTCFGIYLGFFRHGSRKYNFAEYLAAFTYMYAAISIYDIILNLLYIIPGINFDISGFTVIIAIAFSFIVIFKAFPQNKKWKTVLLLLWSFLLGIIFEAIFYILILLMIRHSALMRLGELFQ